MCIRDRYCIVKAHVLSNTTPVYMLWYEETVFGVGHYQSIEPIQENVVTRHYNWSIKNQDSRLDQSELRSRLPSNARSVNSISSITEPDIHSSSNNLNVSISKICHICDKKYTKVSKRKLCACKRLCHLKCLGKCSSLM